MSQGPAHPRAPQQGALRQVISFHGRKPIAATRRLVVNMRCSPIWRRPAFFGRKSDSPHSPARTMVCYKNAKRDDERNGGMTAPTERDDAASGGAAERKGGRRGRGGGRAARRAVRTGDTIEQLRFITRQIPKVELLSEEGLALIEENAETILQEIGIELARTKKPLSC